MTTKVTTSQIDAYCAALKAWGNGERVETRYLHGKWSAPIGDCAFPAFDPDREYRIAERAPPKLREFFVSKADLDHQCAVIAVYSEPLKEPSGAPLTVHVREVSETADAEIAEKLRNHDALVTAIAAWDDENLINFLKGQGAHL